MSETTEWRCGEIADALDGVLGEVYGSGYCLEILLRLARGECVSQEDMNTAQLVGAGAIRPIVNWLDCLGDRLVRAAERLVDLAVSSDLISLEYKVDEYRQDVES